MEEPISKSTNFHTRVTEDRRRRRKDHLDSKNSSRRRSFKLSYKKEEGGGGDVRVLFQSDGKRRSSVDGSVW